MADPVKLEAAPTPQAESIWQKLLAFVMGVLTGVGGSISINVGVSLPPFTISDNIKIFGVPWTITLAGTGNMITLTAAPA
jgi:hypothetical protein